MEPINLKNSKIAQICSKMEYRLPENRCHQKDNDDFMIFINSKYELIENAVLINPWNSTYFAWIDFSISYIFNNLKESQEYLTYLSKLNLTNKFFTIGGWEKEKTPFDKLNVETVIWRFCGGFLLGDKNSILEFTNFSKEYIQIYMNMYKKLTWEVNFWSWLETFVSWKPIWYHTMFSDSIIKIPLELYCKQLCNPKKIVYNYPIIDDFAPSSASHIFYKGYHLLNTRFVNYLIKDDGSYYFLNKDNYIITKNIVSILDKNFIPYNYDIMDDESIELKQTEYPIDYSCSVYGLEDLRLYEYNDKIRFIATNRNYAPIDKNRIIIGDYDIKTTKYNNCKIIDSPNHCFYEKNWIPIISNNLEYFIYKWSPMEICKINTKTNNLETIKIYNNTLTAPNFNKVRGSSVFIEVDNYLLGVVHCSDDNVPRKYYHILVALNKETLCPEKYSETFCFQHIGIEFCIGFYKQDNEYLFWVSKMDRNACFIKINIDEIPLIYEFAKP